ncbi:unnamed protein product [Clavelina lepadiformis]|uniref:Uncharacterized protein n=1 Tax=Clavelina lepadiformis TaxID=159417 RepID=A0ABP0F1W0_CLALP
MSSLNDATIPKLTDDVYVSKPLFLQQLCIDVIKKHPGLLFENNEVGPTKFHSTVFLPALITDDLLEQMLAFEDNCDNLLNVFSNQFKCCLQRLKLANVSVKFQTLLQICTHQKLHTLELINVELIDHEHNGKRILELSNGNRLQTFVLQNVKVQPAEVKISLFKRFNREENPQLTSIRLSKQKCAWSILLSNELPVFLDCLELSDIEESRIENSHILNLNFSMLDGSRYKDDNSFSVPFLQRFSTSSNRKADDAMKMEDSDSDFLHEELPQVYLLPQYRLQSMVKSLSSLILYNTSIGSDDVDVIFRLVNLNYLDISVCSRSDRSQNVERPDVSVFEIINKLPKLHSLDVSATDIANQLYTAGIRNTITGERKLSQPVSRRLDFIALCESDGCEVLDVYSLAESVAGHNSDHQIITSIQHNINRPTELTAAFSRLYEFRRNESHSLPCPNRLLKLLLEAVHRHPQDNNLLLMCTANLFFLTRQSYTFYAVPQRNGIITAFMKILTLHMDNNLIVRNVLLTLYHFDVPCDFIFNFDVIAKTILNALNRHQFNNEVNTLAMHLCNTMVCSLQYDLKRDVRRLDFVPTIVDVIKKRLNDKLCDEVMEVAWSTLWNVTDETPQNSTEFIDLGGLELLEKCFQEFETKPELHKNIMGLVGNIAEVKELRPRLMQSILIERFRKLLTGDSPGIEVKYNSCGTLAHIISDGPEAWTIEEPRRDDVRENMYDVIESWDLCSQRNINYRSFLPILRLAECDVPECIHWAVWALCNLSGIDARYIRLLLEENGVNVLTAVLEKNIRPKTKELAAATLQKIEEYRSTHDSDIQDDFG